MTQIDRVPTGVPGLDPLIEGGFPKGRSILVTGNPGTGKTIFSLQFLAEGLERGEKAIYVAADEPPFDIVEQAASMGWDFEQHIEKKNLAILNAGTYLTSLPGAGKDRQIDIHKAINDLAGFVNRLDA
jgi:KaiC/GvpD/RAD55 family RecA-like ATPase